MVWRDAHAAKEEYDWTPASQRLLIRAPPLDAGKPESPTIQTSEALQLLHLLL